MEGQPLKECSWCEQDPKARPSAKYLQQHKFVVNARQAAAASLVPLIKQSRDLLAQMGEDSPVTLPGARCAPPSMPDAPGHADPVRTVPAQFSRAAAAAALGCQLDWSPILHMF